MSGESIERQVARNEAEQHIALAHFQLIEAINTILHLLANDKYIRKHTYEERMRRKEAFYALHDHYKLPVFAWDLSTEIYKRSFATKEEILADMCARLGWNYTGPGGLSDLGHDLGTGDGADANEVTIPRRESTPMAIGPQMSLREPSAGEKLMMKAQYHLDWALEDMQRALDLDGGFRHFTSQDRTEIAAIIRQVEATLRILA